MGSPHRDESATLKRRLAELRSERDQLEADVRRRVLQGTLPSPHSTVNRIAIFLFLFILLPLPATIAGCAAAAALN